MPVCFALRMGALSSDNLSRPQEPITCMTHTDFSIDDWVDMFDLYVFSSHTVQDENAFETVISLHHTDCRHDGPCGPCCSLRQHCSSLTAWRPYNSHSFAKSV